MTLERLPDGSVCLGAINEWQLNTLRILPALADPGDDDAALRRLFPAPFAAGDATRQQQEDWAEIVQPELEQLFENSLARVVADVKRARLESAPPPADPEEAVEEKKRKLVRPPVPVARRRPRPPCAAAVRSPVVHSSPPYPERWRFTVPAPHVEDWYRAMNQARLMLSQKHEAHRTDGAHIAKMFVSGNMESLIQYGLLSSLCDWWVDALMRR